MLTPYDATFDGPYHGLAQALYDALRDPTIAAATAYRTPSAFPVNLHANPENAASFYPVVEVFALGNPLFMLVTALCGIAYFTLCLAFVGQWQDEAFRFYQGYRTSKAEMRLAVAAAIGCGVLTVLSLLLLVAHTIAAVFGL